MPQTNLYYEAVFQLRRLPLIHRPAKWIRRQLLRAIADAVLDVLRLMPATFQRLGPVKGTFSAIEALRHEESGLKGRIVLEDQGSPKVRDDSLMVVCGMGHHTSQPWTFGWSRFNQARLVSSTLSLVDAEKRVCLEACYGTKYYRNDPAYRTAYLPKATRLAGNWTSVVSYWVPNHCVSNYTHWLIDALPRLAMLPEFPPDTRIIVPGRLASFQRQSLEMMGLAERVRLSGEKHLLVESYYFSSATSMIDCYNPYAVQFLRATLLPKADMEYSGPKKFLLNRSGNKTRGVQNAEEVNRFFTDLGWSIIDAEKLTLAEQIKLFSEAEAIAGVFGSGFVNLVWCQPGCKVLCFSPDGWVDGFYEWIADLNGVLHCYKIFRSDTAMRAYLDLDSIRAMLNSVGL